jgi:hypothetical protein
MIDEASESILRRRLESMVFARKPDELERVKADPKYVNHGISISEESFGMIKVQLRAFGLMTQSIQKRSLKDNYTYWRLTPYGDTVMTQILAIRRREK